MGAAALHIAHTHQETPPRRRRKRSGGGNSDEFAQIAHRIYQDDRANADARQLLLALAWAVTMAPLDENTSEWDAAARALTGGLDRLWDLIRDDVPRYQPPSRRLGTDPLERLCQAPRLRPYPEPKPEPQTALINLAPGVPVLPPEDFRNRLRICGAPASDRVVEKLPGTGWHKNHWFCGRHHDHLERVRQQVAEQNKVAPEPIPNKGGLLPCYFETDWLYLYRWVHRFDEWEPPVYGMCADDWPVPGREPVPPRARLRLAALDGELLGGAQ